MKPRWKGSDGMIPSQVFSPTTNMEHPGISRVPTNLSLLYNPDKPSSKARKVPGVLDSWIFDRYWKDYTATLVERADKVYHKQYLLEKGKIPLAPGDRILMQSLYTEVKEMNQEYHEAKETKKSALARAISHKMKETVFRLEKQGSASYIRAIENQKLLEAYAMISKRISPNSLMSHGSMCPCDLAVREPAVSKIIAWFGSSHKEKRLIWLQGDRGSGKSVLLHHIAKRCMEGNALAAGFTFSKQHTHQAFLDNFLPTIVDQIAGYLHPFKVALSTICSRLLDDSIFRKPIKNQVQDLLIPAHSLLPPEHQQRPLLIVIDGLDDCQDGTLAALFEFMEDCIISLPRVYFIFAGSASRPSAGKILALGTEEILVEDYKTASKKFSSSDVIRDSRISSSGVIENLYTPTIEDTEHLLGSNTKL